MEKYNYVTLFNINYLSRGLVMFRSLKAVSRNFTLYVVCFDDATYRLLQKLNEPALVPISLGEFETAELLRVKAERTVAEYCWTCSSSVILHCINTYQLTNCAYIDADMYFFSDPSQIWEESPTSSVYITLHNYSKPYDQSAVSGKFCVQFVGFRNTPEGMRVLSEWKDDCIAWCYNRVEDGKFGDQKYLDYWPEKYEGIHVVKNKTAGLAPWNIQQFRIFNNKQVVHRETGQQHVPVFFHFHGLKLFAERKVSYTSSYYHLGKKARQEFYYPYALQLLDAESELHRRFSSDYLVQLQSAPTQHITWYKVVRTYLSELKRNITHIHPKFTQQRLGTNYTYKH